jgi:hypothetical protein
MGETINFYGSLFCFTGCAAFIGVYTAMAFITGRVPWWKSHIGRMMVTKAAAIAGLMLIVIVLYLSDIDLEWVRSFRGIFAAVVGVMMFYQAVIVYRLQRVRDGGDET